MNPNVDPYFANAEKWQEELKALRAIILEHPLEEELKWGNPCYTFQENNIALIGSFKNYCALSFFKGVLLKDSDGVLEKPGENSQTVRLIRFTDLQSIVGTRSILKAYIDEAIELEKSGLKVNFKKITEFEIPVELQTRLEQSPDFKAAFDALTPGRQRGYLLYFSAPKQSGTRESRIEKYTQQILDGKGLNDCTCGLSRKPPGCDGSHKQLQ